MIEFIDSFLKKTTCGHIPGEYYFNLSILIISILFMIWFLYLTIKFYPDIKNMLMYFMVMLISPILAIFTAIEILVTSPIWVFYLLFRVIVSFRKPISWFFTYDEFKNQVDQAVIEIVDKSNINLNSFNEVVKETARKIVAEDLYDYFNNICGKYYLYYNRIFIFELKDIEL